ncbi:hypothetical protein ACFSWE_05330 [Leucobacter albus]|uniref:Secreted protein with PEP-CTERM sorting signal n=1 Tax=Leucobacter albus TaxID=272210 RepID=A0ABW3TND3_9MICO
MRQRTAPRWSVNWSRPGRVARFALALWALITGGAFAGRALQALAGEREWAPLPLHMVPVALGAAIAGCAVWAASYLRSRRADEPATEN